MAITPTVLTKGGPSGGTSINTASISPTTNRLLLVMVSRAEFGTPVIPTLSGLGLTWVLAKEQVGSGTLGSIMRTSIFYAWSTGATPGVLTITHSSTTGGDDTQWIVSEWSGTKGSGDNGASGVRQALSSSGDAHTGITLAALADSASASVGFLGWNGGGGGLGSGYTLLDQIISGGWKTHAEYQVPGSTTVNWFAAPSNQESFIGLELAAGSSIGIDVGLAEATATAFPVTVSIGATPSSFTGREQRVELGCGSYKLLLTERGGGHPIAFLPFSNLNWGRVVDDASSASLTVPIGEGDAFETCCRIFEENDSFDGEVDSWSHEIAVLRNDKQVWVGPIVDMTFSFTDIQIQCRDLFAWFDVRLLPKSRDEIGDLAALFQMFAKDALDLEPSPNITISPWAVNTINRFTVLVQDYIVAGNVLREIGKDGVDFTMVGRMLYEGNLDGVATDLGVALQLPQQAVMDGTLQKRGSELATQLTLTGRPPGGSTSTIHATAGGKSDKYGLVQRQQAESFITVPAFLQDAANSRYAHIKTPPRYLDITLDPKAPFLMEQLIAGFLVDVKCRVGCASVIEMMRLHSLNVTVGVDDAGTVTETIQASIVPQGQPTFGFDLGFGGDN